MAFFGDIRAQADLQIFGRLGDPDAVLAPADGSAQIAGPVVVKRPREEEGLIGGGFGRMKPQVHAPMSCFPTIKPGDIFTARADPSPEPAHRWKVLGSPLRPASGYAWICDVEDMGAI